MAHKIKASPRFSGICLPKRLFDQVAALPPVSGQRITIRPDINRTPMETSRPSKIVVSAPGSSMSLGLPTWVPVEDGANFSYGLQLQVSFDLAKCIKAKPADPAGFDSTGEYIVLTRIGTGLASALSLRNVPFPCFSRTSFEGSRAL